MPRPLLLGIAGDSGAGKTTFTRGLVRILGEAQASYVSGDHYQRSERDQRPELGITPLHPDCNYLDVLEQHLHHLRAGEPILKPVYRHRDGTFGAAEYLRPSRFTIVDGMLAFHTQAMRDAFDVRVFLDPPEDLRRHWKVQRDCSRRGYTTEHVLAELDRREADAKRFVRPQQRYADIVVSFSTGDSSEDDHLDATLRLRPGLVHPDLSPLLGEDADGISLKRRNDELVLWISGTIDAERSASIQASIWDMMHFANHLRTDLLGEFTVGTRLHRSETLAIAQLLVLYQAVTGRAAIAIGALDGRASQRDPAPGADLS